MLWKNGFEMKCYQAKKSSNVITSQEYKLIHKDAMGKDEWPLGFTPGKMLWGEKGHFIPKNFDQPQWGNFFNPLEIARLLVSLLLD